MHFINPVEILDLTGTDLATIDQPAIRKAKKALLAEIELSDDGLLHYNGQSLTAADAERYIEELEQQERLEYYHFIANHAPLSAFLLKGDAGFFQSFRHESIYRMDTFIQFISPWFAVAYDRLLLDTFKQPDSATFKAIAAVAPLVTTTDQDIAHKSLHQLLEEQHGILWELVRDLNNQERSAAIDLNAIPAQMKAYFDLEKINAFPPYLHEARNKLAGSLRQLYLILFNNHRAFTIVRSLHEIAGAIIVEGPVKESIQEEIATFDDHPWVKCEVDPVYGRYFNLLEKFPVIIGTVKNTGSSKGGISIWVNKHLDIADLNAQPEGYDFVRREVGMLLQNLAAEIWRCHGDEILASSFLYMAEGIRDLPEEVTTALTETRKKILEFAAARDRKQEEAKGAPIEKVVTGWIVAIIVFLIIYACLHR